MDFFNIGTGELLVIALLALLLFGPQDMIKAMQTFSRYLYRMQQSWRQISAILQQDLLEAGELEPSRSPHIPPAAGSTSPASFESADEIDPNLPSKDQPDDGEAEETRSLA